VYCHYFVCILFIYHATIFYGKIKVFIWWTESDRYAAWKPAPSETLSRDKIFGRRMHERLASDDFIMAWSHDEVSDRRRSNIFIFIHHNGKNVYLCTSCLLPAFDELTMPIMSRACEWVMSALSAVILIYLSWTPSILWQTDLWWNFITLTICKL